MNSKLHNYVTERFGNAYPNIDEVCAIYESYMKDNGIQFFDFPHGFFTAHAKGDAFIVYDLYTDQEHRKKKFAWELFQIIKEEAEKADASVIIGFSEHAGQNHELGRGAMKAAGFVKAFETDVDTVYLRGVH